MKENIEKDMKILEEFIEGLKQYNLQTGEDIKPTQFGEGQRYVYSNVYYAIDNILSDYKRVLKENEELNDKYATFVKMSSEVIANSIPIQKIKDKTEDLKKEYKMELEKNSIKAFILKCQIKALQELLKGENDESI